MEQTSTKHPNAHILRAIADGKAVEWRWRNLREDAQIWRDYAEDPRVSPLNASGGVDWRIKPEEEPLFQRWYLVETRESTVVPALNYTVQRASMEGLVRLLQGNPDLKQNLVGFICMSVDEHTVRKVEFFSKAELKAKGAL